MHSTCKINHKDELYWLEGEGCKKWIFCLIEKRRGLETSLHIKINWRRAEVTQLSPLFHQTSNDHFISTSFSSSPPSLWSLLSSSPPHASCPLPLFSSPFLLFRQQNEFTSHDRGGEEAVIIFCRLCFVLNAFKMISLNMFEWQLSHCVKVVQFTSF